MGLWFLTAIGEKDAPIVEEIAKLHKVDVKIVAKHYEEMLKKIKEEVKENEDQFAYKNIT